MEKFTDIVQIFRVYMLLNFKRQGFHISHVKSLRQEPAVECRGKNSGNSMSQPEAQVSLPIAKNFVDCTRSAQVDQSISNQ